MNISITFDVEVWCGGWRNLDSSFPSSFQRYVYGDGPAGYALPKTLEWMNEFGLQGIFFLEPLFSYRFGIENRAYFSSNPCFHTVLGSNP